MEAGENREDDIAMPSGITIKFNKMKDFG